VKLIKIPITRYRKRINWYIPLWKFKNSLIMKRSIYSIVLDGSTNNSQKREVFKGSTFYKAFYEGNVLTVQFEMGNSSEVEHRFFSIFDERQSVPDKLFPALGSVSDASGVTLFVFDVTHERISFNEKEQELVSFGNYLLNKYAKRLDGVTHADISNWRHERIGVIEIEETEEPKDE
jgi:hypothetical protein